MGREQWKGSAMGPQRTMGQNSTNLRTRYGVSSPHPDNVVRSAVRDLTSLREVDVAGERGVDLLYLQGRVYRCYHEGDD